MNLPPTDWRFLGTFVGLIELLAFGLVSLVRSGNYNDGAVDEVWVGDGDGLDAVDAWSGDLVTIFDAGDTVN
jgi:hypothetical protein